jgi:hypothetical protein
MLDRSKCFRAAEMDNLFQGPYVFLPPAFPVDRPRGPNDDTHLQAVRSIYDRADYLVNLDTRQTEGLARGYRISALTEPLVRVGLPPNDSHPVYTPLAVWRSKVPLDRR